MIDNITQINKDQVHQNVQKMFDDGFRFVTMTCVELEDDFDILYHFDKNYEMTHFRIKILKDEVLESISNIYFCALVVENEIKDLFGVKIIDLAIDYDGKFLLSEGAPFAPMCNTTQIEVEVRKENE